MNRPEILRAQAARAAVAGGRIGVLIVNLGTPDATDAGLGAALSAGVPQRQPRDREPGPGLEVRAQRHHPDHAAARAKAATTRRSGTGSGTNCRSRPSRARRPPSCAPRSTRIDRRHRGRLGDALRQSVARLADRGAGQGRLRAHPAGAALSAIRRGDHRDGVRRGVRDAGEAARPAGAARRAAVLRRSGLHRGAGGFDRGRAEDAAVHAGGHPGVVPRHPEILRRRRRSLSAANAWRRRGCCASGSGSTSAS